MNPNQIGDTAELAIASDLARQGYKIAFPFGDWGCDIIATKNEKDFIRIQVKNAKIRDGAVQVRTHIQDRQTGKRKTYTKAQCDYIAAYSPEMDTCYYISMEKINTSTGMSLRLTETKNNQSEGIHWAEDYTILGD